MFYVFVLEKIRVQNNNVLPAKGRTGLYGAYPLSEPIITPLMK